MQEISLSSKDSKIDCEAVILAVDDGKEAIPYFLSDVENPGQVHETLIMLAELTYTPNEQAAVKLKQLLEHN